MFSEIQTIPDAAAEIKGSSEFPEIRGMVYFFGVHNGTIVAADIRNLPDGNAFHGFHIHEDVIKATYKSIGSKRIVLICDANPCKGLADGIYHFSGKEIEIIDGKARVKATGRIAGSTIKLNQACQNMMRICGCSIDDVVLMASTNPAQLYNLPKGKLEVGYDGDIIVVNHHFDVLAVVNNGHIKKDMLS